MNPDPILLMVYFYTVVVRGAEVSLSSSTHF